MTYHLWMPILATGGKPLLPSSRASGQGSPRRSLRMPLVQVSFLNSYMTDTRLVNKQPSNKLQTLAVLLVEGMDVRSQHSILHLVTDSVVLYLMPMKPSCVCCRNVELLLGTEAPIMGRLFFFSMDGTKLQLTAHVIVLVLCAHELQVIVLYLLPLERASNRLSLTTKGYASGQS